MSGALVRRVRVRCPRDRAFALFTQKLDMWWPANHRRSEASKLVLEAMAGGRFYERTVTGDEVDLGVVLLWQPPHRLVYSWQPGAITKPTEVDVQFDAQGDFTQVEVTHREADSALAEAWADRAAIFTRAWGEVLPAFQRFAEEDQI